MGNIFKDMMKSEPHSLQEIRTSLDSAVNDNNNFFSLLKDHHDFLEESISVLMDKDASDSEKQDNLFRFFRLVRMHGRAEQETLYLALKQNGEKEARLEGFGGQDEHDIAFQMEDELTGMGYQTNWTEEVAAKAKVSAGVVKNHIKEEESTMFPVAQKYLGDSELESLRVDYIEKCKIYLDDTRAMSMANRDRRMTPGTRILHS